MEGRYDVRVPVQVFGNRGRIHLDVWVFGLVAFKVDLEVALGGETVAADVTLEGPLTW